MPTDTAPAAPLALAGTTVDWFSRTENKDPSRMGTRAGSFVAAVDLVDAAAVIAACRAAGCPKGSNRTGLYEVQTDRGILSMGSVDAHGHERKLTDAAVFKTWDELDAEDAPTPAAPVVTVPAVAAPLVVAYGMGVDSTAMLVGMHARGIRPDLILFADTGSEKPETYAYLPVINAWLRSVGFPEVIVVRYVPTRAPYTTLEGNCIANSTLPSLAFGFKSCSLKWKRDPQDKFCSSWQPAVDAWARGAKVVKLIGYDAGPADSRRSKIAEDDQYAYTYPLREWGWTRPDCVAAIVAAGLPVPVKSACYFCPASKKAEVLDMARTHPELVKRAMALEAGAADGPHGLKKVKGLGRNWSWTELLTGSAPGTRSLPVINDTPAEPECGGY